jgi:hypothetical protein
MLCPESLVLPHFTVSTLEESRTAALPRTFPALFFDGNSTPSRSPIFRRSLANGSHLARNGPPVASPNVLASRQPALPEDAASLARNVPRLLGYAQDEKEWASGYLSSYRFALFRHSGIFSLLFLFGLKMQVSGSFVAADAGCYANLEYVFNRFIWALF